RTAPTSRATSMSKPLQLPALSTELCGANSGSSPTSSVPRWATVAASPVGWWPRMAAKRAAGFWLDLPVELEPELLQAAAPTALPATRARTHRPASDTARQDQRRPTSAGHEPPQLGVERRLEWGRSMGREDVARQSAGGLARTAVARVL